MAAPRSGRNRTEMIHCPYCGEDYAASYKRCPFCDEHPMDEAENYGHAYDDGEAPAPKGGKRLISNTRGGGYGGSPSPLKIIGTVLSLAVIVAAVIIVISVVKPLVDKGHTTLGSPPPQNTQTNGPDPDGNVSPSPDASPEGSPEVPPEASGPSPEVPAVGGPEPGIPATQTATGFTINRSDFTLDKAGAYWDLNPTFTPAGTTGTITWVSDKPEVATVNEYGVVTAVSRGTANVTATMAGGFSQSCIVRCNFTSTSSSEGSGTPAQTSESLKLNHTDFTFSSLSDTPVTMRVSGTSSTPSWSIGNTDVATISADGVVHPAGKGTTTITCTVDGQTLTCIVRCSF